MPELWLEKMPVKQKREKKIETRKESREESEKLGSGRDPKPPMGSRVKSKATSSLCGGYARGLPLCVCTCLQGLRAQQGLEMALSLEQHEEVLPSLEYFWTTPTQWTKEGDTALPLSPTSSLVTPTSCNQSPSSTVTLLWARP